MDTIDAIFNRRSIRKYTNETISVDKINLLLESGFCAPSAGNQQPWHFVIIDDRVILSEIQKFHPHASMLEEANKAILVCGDLSIEKHKGYWILDCSASTENILIAAHDQGLGACWLGIYPKKDRIENMKKLLNLPKQIIPLSLISLGYPAEKKTKLNKINKTRVHYNKW
jgi:nitroreductase